MQKNKDKKSATKEKDKEAKKKNNKTPKAPKNGDEKPAKKRHRDLLNPEDHKKKSNKGIIS